MTVRRAIVAAILLGLGACAGKPERSTPLEATAPCCQTWAQLPYRPLNLGRESVFELDESSPVFEFPTGKGYFQAFRLPADTAAPDLAFTSRLPTRAPPAWDAFCPSLTFLDEDHRRIETWPTQAQFAPHLQRWVLELSAPERTRFLVVHLGAAELAGSRPIRYSTSGISQPATYQPGTTVAGGLMNSEAPCGLRGRHTLRVTAAPARPGAGEAPATR